MVHLVDQSSTHFFLYIGKEFLYIFFISSRTKAEYRTVRSTTLWSPIMFTWERMIQFLHHQLIASWHLAFTFSFNNVLSNDVQQIVLFEFISHFQDNLLVRLSSKMVRPTQLPHSHLIHHILDYQEILSWPESGNSAGLWFHNREPSSHTWHLLHQ